MSSLLKEPFVHFIVLGALLFGGNAVWERHVLKSDTTIVIQPGEMERQAVIFASENRRQPTDEDLRALLFSHVEEEVLLREAQRLGLGEDDTIIRRRLAQKMRFMIENTGETKSPGDAELRAWFDQNQAQFVEPERRSFSHIYLSPEKHGDQLQADAQTLLAQISDANWKSLGDPFMLNRKYDFIEARSIERLMGANFATSLFSIKGTDWQGPFESAFGLHLVKINDVKPEALPAFDTIRDDVVTNWHDTTRRAENNRRLRELIEKYTVVVEDGE
jgi:hypothetical protein